MGFIEWWDGLFGDDEPDPIDIEKLRSQCKDYVLIMLGAPVVKVELEDLQLSKCVTEAQNMVMASSKTTHENFGRLMQQLALAHAKIVLGRIRSKYDPCPGVPEGVSLDGFQLINEGREELEKLQSWLGLL